MNKMMGAINTRGFSSCVSTGILPPDSHITYQGVFNQLKFDVGQKTKKILDCHLGYSRYQFKESLFDSQINDYLCLFLKSQRDGQQRNQIPLNTVICLDISGSMSGPLDKTSNRSRLSLSVEAIKMFISQLKQNDVFGLVVFDTKADVLIPPTLKKNMKEQIFTLLDEIKTKGGTTIAQGLTKCKQILQGYLQKNQLNQSKFQNRIIMLTDVGDNSIAGSLQFVNQASKNDNIHLTIVGISNQFKSQTCEILKNVKGFNYFCAINQDDIKKHVFEQFNFNFFPVAHNIQLDLISSDVKSFETFGSPDSDKVRQYNQSFETPKQQLKISKTSSIFPSQIQIKDGKVYTLGGVILLKLKRKSLQSSFKGKLKLSYDDLRGQKITQMFDIQFKFPEKEQYYSDQCLRQALEGYTFASEIKYILRQPSKVQDQKIDKFLETLQKVNKIAPESKLKDLENLKKILQQKRKAKVQKANPQLQQVKKKIMH